MSGERKNLDVVGNRALRIRLGSVPVRGFLFFCAYSVCAGAHANVTTSFSSGLEADTNPNLVPHTDEATLFRGWIEPGQSVSWRQGRYQFDAGAAVYVERSSDDNRSPSREDFRLSLHGERGAPRGMLSMSADYEEQPLTTEIFDDTGAIVADATLIRTSVQGRGEYHVSRRAQLNSELGYQSRRYDVDAFAKQERSQAGAGYRYRYSRRTDLSIDVDAKHYHSDQRASVWQYSGTVGAEYQPNPRTELIARVGLTRVPDEVEGRATGLLQAGWSLDERTRASVSASRGVTMSASAQMAVSDRVQAGVTRTLSPRTVATLGASWIEIQEAERRDLRMFTAGLSRILTSNWSLGISYRYSALQREYVSAGYGHVATVTLSYRPAGF